LLFSLKIHALNVTPKFQSFDADVIINLAGSKGFGRQKCYPMFLLHFCRPDITLSKFASSDEIEISIEVPH